MRKERNKRVKQLSNSAKVMQLVKRMTKIWPSLWQFSHLQACGAGSREGKGRGYVLVPVLVSVSLLIALYERMYRTGWENLVWRIASTKRGWKKLCFLLLNRMCIKWEIRSRKSHITLYDLNVFKYLILMLILCDKHDSVITLLRNKILKEE